MSINWLFVDMDSFFATAEQQLQPWLRGRPVGVVPMHTDTTCCIAASYEAKAFGVKTGTPVYEAKRRCPGIQLVQARTAEYVHLHNQIKMAVDTVLPVHQVHSIDEMSCRLMGEECEPENARNLARDVKSAIWNSVGEVMNCSIGLAPNHFLSKVASGMNKPNGITLLQQHELPGNLFRLSLSDLPGIGRGMLRRLNGQGITTIEQLCAQSRGQLQRHWKSVVGARWWDLLRGFDVKTPPTHRRTVGHSHVLPPKFRSSGGAYEVLVKLLHKAAERLRRIHYWAGSLTVEVTSFKSSDWQASRKLGLVQETPAMLSELKAMWEQRPDSLQPHKVGVVLSDLVAGSCATQPLFTEPQQRTRLSHVVDSINDRLGRDRVYFGAMHHSRDTAPDRIAFTQIPEIRD